MKLRAIILIALGLLLSSCAGSTSATNRPILPEYNPPPRFLNEKEPVSFLPPDATYVKFSPDRTQLAHSYGRKGLRAIYVTPIGGQPRLVSELTGDVREFHWQGDGTALVYVERLYKEFPGQFVDWNIPKTETLGYRILRLPLAGGGATVLAEVSENLDPNPGTTTYPKPLVVVANPKNDQVVYMASNMVGTTGPLWLVGGGMPSPVKLDEGENYSDLSWSPDGSKLAYSASWSGEAGPTEEVRVMDISSRKVQVADTTPAEDLRKRAEISNDVTLNPFLVWLADSGKLNILRLEGDTFRNPRMRLKTYSFEQDESATDEIDLTDPKTGVYEYSSFIPSPDGTQLLCFRGRIETGGGIHKVSQTVVVSLTHHSVTVLGEPVGLAGWLDNERVLYSEGTGKISGLYTARVPMPTSTPRVP